MRTALAWAAIVVLAIAVLWSWPGESGCFRIAQIIHLGGKCR
jgi:hypothetical protein